MSKKNRLHSYIAAVPIGVVASFRKMKKLTKDTSWIVAALKESTFLVSGYILLRKILFLRVLQKLVELAATLNFAMLPELDNFVFETVLSNRVYLLSFSI